MGRFVLVQQTLLPHELAQGQRAAVSNLSLCFAASLSGHVAFLVFTQQGCLQPPDINNASHSPILLSQVWTTGLLQDQMTATLIENEDSLCKTILNSKVGVKHLKK